MTTVVVTGLAWTTNSTLQQQQQQQSTERFLAPTMNRIYVNSTILAAIGLCAVGPLNEAYGFMYVWIGLIGSTAIALVTLLRLAPSIPSSQASIEVSRMTHTHTNDP